jgi:hypothetical protein
MRADASLSKCPSRSWIGINVHTYDRGRVLRSSATLPGVSTSGRPRISRAPDTPLTSLLFGLLERPVLVFNDECLAGLVDDHEIELAGLGVALVLSGPVDPVKNGVGGWKLGLELARGF